MVCGGFVSNSLHCSASLPCPWQEEQFLDFMEDTLEKAQACARLDGCCFSLTTASVLACQDNLDSGEPAWSFDGPTEDDHEACESEAPMD